MRYRGKIQNITYVLGAKVWASLMGGGVIHLSMLAYSNTPVGSPNFALELMQPDKIS